jgi:hypothetical protein
LGLMVLNAGRHLRKTQRRNADGSIVRYLQLANNHRVGVTIKAEVLVNLGREDELRAFRRQFLVWLRSPRLAVSDRNRVGLLAFAKTSISGTEQADTPQPGPDTARRVATRGRISRGLPDRPGTSPAWSSRFRLVTLWLGAGRTRIATPTVASRPGRVSRFRRVRSGPAAMGPGAGRRGVGWRG